MHEFGRPVLLRG